MAETTPLTTNPPPFRDILNRSFEAIQRPIQHSKSKQRQQQDRHFDRSLSRKSSRRSDIREKNDSDLTVRKEKAPLHPELASVKTIHDQRCQMANEMVNNAEWEVLKYQTQGEIARILRLQCDFRDTKTKFIQFARKQKLIVCQNTESFVTVKKGGAGSCRCLYQMWTNSSPQATVYQLRKYGRNDARAKLILVEGDKSIFYSFFIRCLKHFSSQKLVQLLVGQKVEIIFQEQSKEIYNCQQAIGYLSKRLAKGKKIGPSQIDSTVARFKKQSSRLKQIIRTSPDLCDVPSMEAKVELMCYKTSGILSIFDQLYQKDFQAYRRKRESLLKKHAISELFRQLQIQEHFNQFKRLRSLKQIQFQEKIPYLAAIRDLKLLANRQFPSSALEMVISFHQKIRSCYSRYFRNCSRLGDMDDYLPVTIFCVLAVDCDQNLLAIVKWLLCELNGVEDNEWQKKTLTDLEAAFEYIQNQWQLG